MAIQGVLFWDDERRKPQNVRIPAVSDETYPNIIFDFERDGDRSVLIPDATWKIPTWLALKIDDPDWTPETRIG